MINKAILGIIILSLICFRAKGDSPLAAMAKNYLQVEDVNISYEAKITLELAPAVIQNYQRQNIDVDEPRWQDHIFFSSDKVGFGLVVLRSGAHHNVDAYSYDGTNYALYDGKRDQMIVSKSSPKVAQAWDLNSLILPAGLLARNHNSFSYIDCEWRDVINPKFWSSITGAVFSGGPLSKSVEGPLNGMVNGKKITMKLSNKNFPFGIAEIENYPEAIDPGAIAGSPAGVKTLVDRPVIKYTLNEVGETTFTKGGLKTTFFYPKKATFQRFSQFTGDLLRTDIHEITKIIVNDPHFDETRFSVDPSSTTHIFDEDSGRWVIVPK